MYGFGSDATSSAGQRTGNSPDYAPPKSPRPSLIITIHLPPGRLRLFPQLGVDESGDATEESEEESLDDSSEDGFEDSLIEEMYDNTDKKFFYDSDNESYVVGTDEEDDGVVYESIEFDEDNSENVTAGQSLNEVDDQSDNARAVSATPLASPDRRANSPTGKLLASCLDTNKSLFHDYLTQRKTLAVEFLECNNDVVEHFLARHPIFVEQFLRRNYQDTLSLFADDPRWFIEDYLNKHSYLVEGYLVDHPKSVEGFINANPEYFDQYLIRHPEFAINYLHYNRLPSGYGIPPDMLGVTSIITPPPSHVRTQSPPSVGLPSPDTSPPAAPPPLPPPLLPADGPGHKSTTRKPQAIRKPPTKPASRSQQSLPKATLAEAGPKTQQRPPASVSSSASATLPSLVNAPITPDSAPKKIAGPSRSKSTTASAAVAPSNSSSHAQAYNVLLTSAYNQTAGQFMGYPASMDILAASRKQDAGTKGSWRLFEEDRAIKHMLDVRDEAQLAGESRFQEVSHRLTAEGIERGFFAVKNYWNRTGRARSGFDERKNKTAPLATSKQGKAFRQRKKAKGQSKNKRGKRVKAESEGEEDDDDDDSSEEYSLHSEEGVTTPPPPPPPPPPVLAPALPPAPQKSAMKRQADYDDAALAKAQSYGTRPKKQRTG